MEHDDVGNVESLFLGLVNNSKVSSTATAMRKDTVSSAAMRPFRRLRVLPRSRSNTHYVGCWLQGGGAVGCLSQSLGLNVGLWTSRILVFRGILSANAFEITEWSSETAAAVSTVTSSQTHTTKCR